MGATLFQSRLSTIVGALKEISIPDTVTTIESGAFGGTGISEFAYPPHVTAISGLGDMPRLTRVEIGENAVSVTGMGNCPLLETLIIRATTPPTTDYWTLLNAPRIPNIYVPDTAVSAYKTASGWSKWRHIFGQISENGRKLVRTAERKFLRRSFQLFLWYFL